MRILLAPATLLIFVANLTGADAEKLSFKSKDLDSLFASELRGTPGPRLDDEAFLRRVTLDLVGRQPTSEELVEFRHDAGVDKRTRNIDRLLESKEFGRNWANYWSDAVSYRVPPPELTFLSYKPFKAWLADKLNASTPWDEIVRDLVTADGTIKENPAVTFVGYHRGNPARLAAETSRIFLGLQIQCAECHDHKFDHWKRKQFHGLAAFFARTDGKLGTVQDGSSTVVKDKTKGEYEMPHPADPRKKGTVMKPTFLDASGLDLDAGDTERREFLAWELTRPENPWFAKAYVNRLWARLLGRGFYEPVDNMADYVPHLWPKTHQALAGRFAASKFDIKGFFRVVMNSAAYQRARPLGDNSPPPAKLRGDEVFASLVNAIGLPNTTPPAVKATGQYRFPPPPKSTSELVCDKFGYDPSLTFEEVSRTLSQAMLLMNNEQVQKQINADPKSNTLLGKLLAKEADDKTAVSALFQEVLARKPTDKEVQIALEHIADIGQRGPAFEDILWGLINSAEFTTRR